MSWGKRKKRPRLARSYFRVTVRYVLVEQVADTVEQETLVVAPKMNKAKAARLAAEIEQAVRRKLGNRLESCTIEPVTNVYEVDNG